jgi:hypothetical protein
MVEILGKGEIKIMKWISVKDKLPELRKKVLICYKIKKKWIIEIAYREPLIKKKDFEYIQWLGAYGNYLLKLPIYWMPLIEPPEEK